MASSKFQNKITRGKKSMLLLISLVLLLTLSVGGTLAYLIVESGTVTNRFERGFVTSSVNEGLTVTNTGNVDAYIRAAVVVNFEAEGGGVHAIAPVYETDYTVTPNTGWELNTSDGYYYYSGIVPSGNTVAAPVTVNNLSDKDLRVEVVAEAIQADGMGAGNAVAAWAAAN